MYAYSYGRVPEITSPYRGLDSNRLPEIVYFIRFGRATRQDRCRGGPVWEIMRLNVLMLAHT
jgi:hypothetical protein